MQNTASATVMRGIEPRTTTYTYDALGRVERVSDPGDRVVRTAYDVLNRVLRVIGPDSTVVRYGYDDPARTYTLTDPKGQTYSTVSNALGWVESQTDPRGKVERFTYDRDGNVTRYTNRRLQEVISTYDTQGRIRTRTADAKTTRFDYDPARLWVAVENEEGADTLRIDDAGRPVEAIAWRNARQYVIASGYGDNGLRNALTVTGSWGTRPIASLGYDNVFRLNYFRAFSEQRAAGLTYTPDQLVERVTLPTGTPTDTTRLRMSFGYTPLHAPAKIGFSRPGVEAALGRSYAHDELERIAVIYRQSALGGQERRVMSYDSLGRIADYLDVRIWESDETVCEPVSPPNLPECHPVAVQHVDTLRQERYAYDKADNRTDRGAVVQTGNRLTSFAGYTMEYDDDGNLVRKFRLDSLGVIAYEQTFVWNSLSQLQSVTTNGSTTSFGYSGWGQRVRKTTAGVTTRYLWDDDDLVMELDGAGNPVREYAYYPGIDQPNAMRRVSDEVIGLRRKDADSVTVELGAVQSGGPEGGPLGMPFGSHIIEVAEADAPELGTAVTVTFALQA
jgi:YD repeat-containing protein